MPLFTKLVAGLALCLGPLGGCMLYGDPQWVDGELANLNGQVLRTYTNAANTVYVWTDGPRIHKWSCRIGDGCPNEDRYSVDRVVHVCRVGHTVVDCAGVKNDPDLHPYITW